MDEAIRDRANRSLEHVFTLLALALPREPLRIAFRGSTPMTCFSAAPRSSTSTPRSHPRFEAALAVPRGQPAAPPETQRSPHDALQALLSSKESIVLRLRI
jgi:hypothetical protein